MKKIYPVVCMTAIAALSTGNALGADVSRPFSSMFVLGDSLSDAGSYSAAISSSTTVPLTYRFTTNFTDGSARTYAEDLAADLGLSLGPNVNTAATPSTLGGNDYAQGGARVNVAGSTANAAYNNAYNTSYAPASGITANSVKQQVDSLLAANPTLNSNELFVIWAGNNDVLQSTNSVLGLGSPSLTAAQASANVTLAASDLVTQINRLKAAGAQYITVNTVPNFTLTPAFNYNTLVSIGESTTNAAAASGEALALTNQFNNSLYSDLKGSNVTIVNTSTVLNAIVSNPSKFGFSVTAATAFTPLMGTDLISSCSAGSTAAKAISALYGVTTAETGYSTTSLTCIVPTAQKSVANGYIFTDLIHPTSAAQAIFGQYANATLQTVGRQATMVVAPGYAIRQQSADLETRLSPTALLKDNGLVNPDGTTNKGAAAGNAPDPGAAGGDGLVLRPVGNTVVWQGGSLVHFNNDSTQVAPSYASSGGDYAIGADTMLFFNTLVGGSLTLAKLDSTFGDGSGGYHTNLYLGTLYSTVALSKHIYINAEAQYGSMGINHITRQETLGSANETMVGDTTGTYESGKLALGYADTFGKIGVTTTVDFSASHTAINGYSESNTDSLGLSFGQSTYDTRMIGAAIAARYNGNKDDFIPFARLSLDHDFQNQQMQVSVGPDAADLATQGVNKPMVNFAILSLGIAKQTQYGRFLLGVDGSGSDHIGTRGAAISLGYDLAL